MADDFAPANDTKQVTFVKDAHQRRRFYPAVGGAAFVVYIEATAEKETEVRDALAAVAKLAAESEQLEWHPTKDDMCEASVTVRVTVSKNARRRK